MKLIDKDAVKAEIEKLRKEWSFGYSAEAKYRTEAYKELVDLLDTLKVKAVDLEKEIDIWYQNKASKEFEKVFYEDIEECAKHFFELGLNVK